MLKVKIESYSENIPDLKIGQVRSCLENKGYVLIAEGKGTNRENGHDFIVIALNNHTRARVFQMRFGCYATEEHIKNTYPKVHTGELKIINMEETNK